MVVAGSLAWNVAELKGDILEVARITARAAYEEDVIYRLWHEVTLGRKDCMLELKSEVNALLKRSGEPIRYDSQGRRWRGNVSARDDCT